MAKLPCTHEGDAALVLQMDGGIEQHRIIEACVPWGWDHDRDESSSVIMIMVELPTREHTMACGSCHARTRRRW